MDEQLFDLLMLQKAFSDSLNLSIEESECPIHLGVVNKMITDKLNNFFDIYNDNAITSIYA